MSMDITAPKPESLSSIPTALLTRLLVEDFIYREAALLDAWAIDEWFALFTDDSSYEVTPPGVDDADNILRTNVYFLIGDDHKRLEHRIARLSKPNAHVESPRSKVRHVYSNIIVAEDRGTDLTAYANFITFRTKRGTIEYFGRIRFVLVRSGSSFMIHNKRVMMDIDALVPQGKVSILL
jgi:p-cumate 2,3-dioxygenase beta subunit